MIRVLGFENEEIKKAYLRAEKSKLYEARATFRGGPNLPLRTDGSQGIFLPEMTESYVGVNDFYPFVRAELQET